MEYRRPDGKGSPVASIYFSESARGREFSIRY